MLHQRLNIFKNVTIDSLANKPDVLLAKMALRLQTKTQSQLRVVPQFGVRIERQMVGEQVDVVRQEQRQPLFHPTSDAAVLAAPKKAVVYKDCVRLRSDGSFNQRPTRGDARNHLANIVCTFDLQAVGTVIPKTLRLEQIVKALQKLSAISHIKIVTLDSL